MCFHSLLAAVAKKRYMNLQASAEAEENNYRDSVHLVKVTNNSSEAEGECVSICADVTRMTDALPLFSVFVNSFLCALVVPVSPRRIWAQSSIESGSYDTDYEQHDISPETAFPLSTFQSESLLSVMDNTEKAGKSRDGCITGQLLYRQFNHIEIRYGDKSC